MPIAAGLSFAQTRWEINIRYSLKEVVKVGAMVKLKKSSDQFSKQNQAGEPVLIKLSPEAKTNLKKLQLLSLDSQGRQPEPSQVIEKLINAAVVSGPDAPYPG